MTTITGGLRITGGLTIGALSFTISPSDIVSSQTFGGPAPTLDSSSQFTVQSGNNLGNGFSFYPTPEAAARITAVIEAAGLNINEPYAWNVSWSTGGIGAVRLEYYSGSNINIMPIDTTVSNWQTNDVYSAGSAKAGTFAFPATFTVHRPNTQMGTNNQWC